MQFVEWYVIKKNQIKQCENFTLPWRKFMSCYLFWVMKQKHLAFSLFFDRIGEITIMEKEQLIVKQWVLAYKPEASDHGLWVKPQTLAGKKKKDVSTWKVKTIMTTLIGTCVIILGEQQSWPIKNNSGKFEEQV